MTNIIPLSLAVILLLSLSTRLQAEAPGQIPPSNTTGIDEIEYHGSGCPQGSIASNISSDGQAFTVIFSNYAVDSSTRQGRPVRKACELDVQLRLAQGWQFTVFGVDVRGYADLQPGIVGVQKILFSFGRGAPQPIGRQRLVGPYADNFQNHSDLPLNQLEWSECRGPGHRKFKLRTAIVVRPDRGFKDDDGDNDQGSGKYPDGLMTIDSLDGGLAQVYRVAWRRCQ